MSSNRLMMSASLALAIVLVGASSVTWADRGQRDDDRRGGPQYSERRGHVPDGRHHRYDRYYPPRGRMIEKLPPRHYIVPHRGVNYYFSAGVWYRHSGTRFVVVVPPVGLVVPFLPPYYATVWVGGVPYYYAGGVYYAWDPPASGYVVTEPPQEAEIVEESPEAEELFIYPKKGQSEQQQAADRYQCHRWAVGQTSFDPTKPGGNVPAAQHASKRSDYQRAMKACLEARGYSVK